MDDVPDLAPDSDVVLEELGDVDLMNLPLPDYPGDFFSEE